jgi:primary-amine oxidase
MQRHSTSGYVSSTKNVYFTLRSVSTVGNYDYMFRLVFLFIRSLHCLEL